MDSFASTGHLDRCGAERLDDRLVAALWADPTTRVVDWSPDGALVDTDGDRPRLTLDSPHADAAGERDLTIFLGRDDNGAAWLARIGDASACGTWAEAVQAPGVSQSPDMDRPIRRLGLRDVGHELSDLHREAFMITQALGSWHLSHRRCPRCGTPTVPVHAGWVRRCEADGSEHYPRTDPAVIMAVTDPDDRLLLARAPAWPVNRRSVLAGFVEPGEPAEDAVAREVAEEVGLALEDIVYFGSQPWPFPASLMLGFSARTHDPHLTIDDDEIVEAQWYTRGALRDAVVTGELGLPGRLSIARRLIEAWNGRPLQPPREVSFHRSDPDGRPSSGR